MINTLKFQVEQILRDFPESRNSDITLMIELWKRYFPHYIRTGTSGELGIWLQGLYDLPREDGISRLRRLIQNDETRIPELRFLPTSWEVARQRSINEETWRIAMRQH